MGIQTSFRHVYGLTHAVLEDANSRQGKQYTARPWNKFEPNDSLWYLVPNTNWPAYPYGKGVLRPSQWYPGRVLCGLHVEKGFDPVVGTVYPALTQRGHILDEKKWIWQRFMHDLSTGQVEEVATKVAADTGFPVTCEIDVWYSTDPTDFEPHSVPDGDASPDPCQRPGTAAICCSSSRKRRSTRSTQLVLPTSHETAEPQCKDWLTCLRHFSAHN